MVYLCSVFITKTSMKKIFISAILLFILASIVSCRKDDPSSPNINSITFGNYEGMEVVTFDSIDWEYYEDSFRVCYEGGAIIDGDDNCSFGLSSSARISYDYYTIDYCEIFIGSTHLAFQYETYLNNEYIHVDTTTLQTDSIPSVFIDGMLTCNMIDESDQLYQSNNKKQAVFHSKDEVLSIDDSFMIYPTGCFCLYYSNDEPPTQVTETPEAVVFEHWILAPEDCLFAPLEEEFYMGFKYSNEGRDRLGWVKLIIEPNPNCIFLVRPLEAAIQK